MVSDENQFKLSVLFGSRAVPLLALDPSSNARPCNLEATRDLLSDFFYLPRFGCSEFVLIKDGAPDKLLAPHQIRNSLVEQKAMVNGSKHFWAR